MADITSCKESGNAGRTPAEKTALQTMAKIVSKFDEMVEGIIERVMDRK